MIVAIGLYVDDTLTRFVKCATEAEVETTVVDLPTLILGKWRFDLLSGGDSEILLAGRVAKLRSTDSYFCRLIDLSMHPSFSEQADRWRALAAALKPWLDRVSGRVANRCDRCFHNSSKPLHEAVLQEMGFEVPESITSSSRTDLDHFLNAGPAISKTVCGQRADCVLVEKADLDYFSAPDGPIHLQRMIKGADARIHVIGDRVVGQRIASNEIDYRRASLLEKMEVFSVPARLRDQLVASTAKLGLSFAGWDFKIDDGGRFWCLEVNPMPGYYPYDVACGGLISLTLVRYLVNEGRQQ